MIIPVLGLEEWKPIPGFAGYEVSNYGNFRTYRSANGKGKLRTEPRELKSRSISGKPYLRVTLTNPSGKQVDHKAHVLVLLTFIGPAPNSDQQTRHLNGNHQDNRLDNLAWGTPQENADDRIAHGTQLRGEDIRQSVLTEAHVREIKAEIPNWKRGTTAKLSRKYNVGRTAINNIRDNITWRHV